MMGLGSGSRGAFLDAVPLGGTFFFAAFRPVFKLLAVVVDHHDAGADDGLLGAAVLDHELDSRRPAVPRRDRR